MAAVRLEHSGNAVSTTLNANFNSGALTFTIVDATGWPTGAVGPFIATIGAGTASEEKVQCLSRSGNTVTVNTGGRGYDSTTNTNHLAGDTVQHTYSATEADQANAHLMATTGEHGLGAGVPFVGTTSSQTLTNKTLDSTTVFPAQVVLTSGNQTIGGNKTYTGNNSNTGGSGTTPSLSIAPGSDAKALKIVRGTDTSPAQPLISARNHADAADLFLVDATGALVAPVVVGGSGASPSLKIAPTTDTVPVKILRGTDTAPAQKLIVVRNNADSSDIYTLDASGNSVGNAFNSFSANIRNVTAGAFFAADSVALKVQRGTDTSPASDVLQVTKADGSTNLWKIDNNGNIVNKVAAQATQQTANVGSITTTEVTVSNGSTSSVTFDGNTKILLSFDWFGMQSTAAGDTWEIRLKSSVAGVIHAQRVVNQKVSSTEAGGHIAVPYTPSAAAHTFSAVMIRISGTGTGTFAASSTGPASLMMQVFV